MLIIIPSIPLLQCYRHAPQAHTKRAVRRRPSRPPRLVPAIIPPLGQNNKTAFKPPPFFRIQDKIYFPHHPKLPFAREISQPPARPSPPKPPPLPLPLHYSPLARDPVLPRRVADPVLNSAPTPLFFRGGARALLFVLFFYPPYPRRRPVLGVLFFDAAGFGPWLVNRRVSVVRARGGCLLLSS